MTSEERQALLEVQEESRRHRAELDALTEVSVRQAAMQAVLVGILVEKRYLTATEAAMLSESLSSSGRMPARALPGNGG